MLPTFVIGLREGLEAALIVGIVAAFLRQRGRIDLLRWALAGVGAAIALCLAIGIALDVISHELPQREQEGLETVIGGVAVLMVTYMVVWMRRHSRTLKSQLEGAAGAALAAGSGFALVVMAFLAVLREGLETVVFLLAAFNQTGSGPLAATGAVLGIAVAVVLGWGIYRGGVRLNLSKFFRITGIVLTFVAAGLVVSALHTAHEAGWLTVGQQSTVDLTALVRPGSVQAALLTGMLGVQPKPVLIEVIGWLVYVIPVGLYIAWPPGRGLSNHAIRRVAGVAGVLAIAAAIVFAVLLPGRPQRDPMTRAANGESAQVIELGSDDAVIAATVARPAQSVALGGVVQLQAKAAGDEQHLGIATRLYRATLTEPVAAAPQQLTYAELATRNGGRLPLGVRAGDGTTAVDVQSQSVDQASFWVVAGTGRIVDVRWQETITLTAQLPIGPTVIGAPIAATSQLPAAAAATAADAARADQRDSDRRSLLAGLATVGWVLAGLCAVLVAALALASRRRPAVASPGPGDPAQFEGVDATPAGLASSSDIAPGTRRSELTRS